MTFHPLPLAVEQAVLPLGVEVSTVDGLDFPGMGYCETMIFGGEYDQTCGRTYDRDDARLMHDRVMRRLAAGSNPWAIADADDAVAAADAGLAVPVGVDRRSYLAGFERALDLMSESPGRRVLLSELLDAAKAAL